MANYNSQMQPPLGLVSLGGTRRSGHDSYMYVGSYGTPVFLTISLQALQVW